MIHFKKKSILCATLALAASMVFGCSKEQAPDTITTTSGIDVAPVTIFGKVIDASTREGVGSVKVYMKVNGSWRSTTTSTGSTVIPAQSKAGIGAAETDKGDFVFSDLPVTTSGYPIVFQPSTSTGYLQKNGNTGALANLQEINNVSVDLGSVEMEKGVTATVRVVSGTTGNYVTSVNSSGTDQALPIYWGFGGAGSGSIEDILATRDTTDTNKYTIVIPQRTSSTITVPALDTTGDGLLDYTGGTVTITASCVAGTGACDTVTTGDAILNTNVVVYPIDNTTALTLVASNVQSKGDGTDAGTEVRTLGKSDSIKLLYNIPVEAPSTTTEGITLTYTDDFSVLTAAAVTAEVTTTVTASGALLTVTPSAALTENQTYTLTGSVKSDDEILNGGADSVAAITVTPAGGQTFTVYATGTGTLGSTPTVTVDNFNHWTNGAVITATDAAAEAAAQPFLVFPELVWGTVRHVSTTAGGVTTLVNGAPTAITGQAITYYNTVVSTNAFNNSGANRAGALFRWDLTALGIGVTADSITATPQSFLLGIDAYDSEGNTYRTETSFSVQ